MARDKAGVARIRTERTGPMELVFIGTRGNTKIRTRRHRRHSALLINHRGQKTMIDCGADCVEITNRTASSLG